jgi:segregation and condensation protein A
VIHLSFPGFTGSLEALRKALRRGRLSPKEVPVLLVVDQALSQVPEDLKARSELLPVLAELLLLKLAPEKALIPKEEGEEAPLVRVLLDLSETVAFLEARLKRRARLLPVPPPPLPKPALRLPPKALLQAARGFQKAVLHLPQGGFGLKEAWARLRPLLKGRVVFQSLPFPAWAERAVAFAALLEAHRLGQVRLYQEAPFAPLHVEALGELQDLDEGRGVA